MCGPIACSYALPLASQKPSLLWSYHLRYTLGRLLFYGWLGALMGAIGIGFGQMLSKTESLRELAGWLAASVLVLEGLAGAEPRPGMAPLRLQSPEPVPPSAEVPRPGRPAVRRVDLAAAR